MVLNPTVANLLFGFSSSPAITSLNGSATIALVSMYSELNGLILSSIFALKSTGNFSRATFNMTLVAVSFNLSTVLQDSFILFQYLEISLGQSVGSSMSINFFTAALVILHGFPYLPLSSVQISS